jgi:serine/threonine protein kinase
VTLWCDPAYAVDSFLDRAVDPDTFFSLPGCTIVKDQRKIKVGRFAIELNGNSRSLYIKRYNSFSWRRWLGSAFVRSGADRARRGAAILLTAGVQTARPVAAIEERKRGLITRSFYMSEEVVGGETADRYWRDLLNHSGDAGRKRRREFLVRLAELFRNLHGRGIYHNDLKDANILVVDRDTEIALYLLDLEGVRQFATVDARRRVKNCVQLLRTFGRYLRASQKMFWLRHYLQHDFARRPVRRGFAARVLAVSARIDAAKGVSRN